MMRKEISMLYVSSFLRFLTTPTREISAAFRLVIANSHMSEVFPVEMQQVA
jgi:hypothetical protein